MGCSPTRRLLIKSVLLHYDSFTFKLLYLSFMFFKFVELQDLGYRGFAWAQYEDLILFASTQSAQCFSSQRMTDLFLGMMTFRE